MSAEFSKDAENYPENLLTCIHDSYTVSATNEVDELIIKHFLNVLAEVAMAVASRSVESKQ